ncbi:MAG: hypothetical protein V4459_15345 [Pseudomonadota bacterium]
MNGKPRRQRLPNCSFASLLHFLDAQRENSLPNHVDVALFGRGHKAIANGIVASLAALELIDPTGAPTPALDEMITAPGTRKAHLRTALVRAYPVLHGLLVADNRTNTDQIERLIRTRIERVRDSRATQFVIDTSRYLVSIDAD